MSENYESPAAELNRRAEALGVPQHMVSLNNGAEALKLWNEAVAAAKAKREAEEAELRRLAEQRDEDEKPARSGRTKREGK